MCSRTLNSPSEQVTMRLFGTVFFTFAALARSDTVSDIKSARPPSVRPEHIFPLFGRVLLPHSVQRQLALGAEAKTNRWQANNVSEPENATEGATAATTSVTTKNTGMVQKNDLVWSYGPRPYLYQAGGRPRTKTEEELMWINFYRARSPQGLYFPNGRQTSTSMGQNQGQVQSGYGLGQAVSQPVAYPSPSRGPGYQSSTAGGGIVWGTGMQNQRPFQPQAIGPYGELANQGRPIKPNPQESWPQTVYSQEPFGNGNQQAPYGPQGQFQQGPSAQNQGQGGRPVGPLVIPSGYGQGGQGFPTALPFGTPPGSNFGQGQSEYAPNIGGQAGNGQNQYGGSPGGNGVSTEGIQGPGPFGQGLPNVPYPNQAQSKVPYGQPDGQPSNWGSGYVQPSLGVQGAMPSSQPPPRRNNSEFIEAPGSEETLSEQGYGQSTYSANQLVGQSFGHQNGPGQPGGGFQSFNVGPIQNPYPQAPQGPIGQLYSVTPLGQPAQSAYGGGETILGPQSAAVVISPLGARQGSVLYVVCCGPKGSESRDMITPSQPKSV